MILGLFVLFLSSHLHPFVNAQRLIVPSSPTSNNVVAGNFLGISFELSFMNEYFGNDTDTIPQPMLNYLGQIRSRTGSPVRIRVGGNSADTSTYVQSQTSPMLALTDPNANSNNQPVNYGPMLWEVMGKVADEVQSVQYLIALTLNTTANTNSAIAGDAAKILGSHLDAMLLGNEPDLYTAHGQRPNVQNYTADDYIGEFAAAVQNISNTTAGNLADGHHVAGPTVCCDWDLATLLQQGYLSNFTNELKYVTLQHYPQNNCFGSYQYPLAYYTQHGNVVALADWQKPGIDIVNSNTAANSPRMLMSEFNSASCGGISGISDTFAVGTLWSVDYALQMAAIGYIAAYIHTREEGISYNMVTPPNISQVDSNSWSTSPPFYALITASEILASSNGSIVADLNVSSDPNATISGYAVYDAPSSSLNRIALFNYGNDSVEFTLPGGMKATNAKNTLVKFLSGESITEKYNIAWGEQTFLGVGDGEPVSANTSSGWAYANQAVDCSNGCNITVPGPSLAVVFLDSTSQNQSEGGGHNSARRNHPGIVVVILALTVVGAVFLLI